MIVKRVRMRNSALLIVVMCMLCQTQIFPLVTSGADFMKIPRSARAIALGESYTAVIDDPTAIDYNPAALNTIKNIAFSVMYQSWIANGYGIYGAGALRLSDFVIGANYFYFNYGGLKEYDYYGYKTAEYNPADMSFKVAASMDAAFFTDVLRGLSLGASLCYINRTLLDETLMGFSLDTGLNYKTTLGKILPITDDYQRALYSQLPINFGFVIQNIGFSAGAMTPMRFAGGMSVMVFPDFIISMDVSKDIFETPWMFKMGAEYTIFEILSLRMGFNLGRESGNFSMGLGLRYPLLFDNLRFDYAFTPLGVLGTSHNFSLYGEFKFNVRAEDYYMKGVYYFSKRDFLNTRKMWTIAVDMEKRNGLYRERLERIEEIITIQELETYKTVASSKSDALEGMIIRDLYGEKPGAVVMSNRVVFTYRSISRIIQSVAITGDFNNWDTNGVPMTRVEDGWTITLAMKPGLRQYKYIVDKVNFITDPANPEYAPDGMGGRNSVVNVPQFEAPETNNMNMTDTNLSGTTDTMTNRQETVNNEQKIIFTNLNIRQTNDGSVK